MSVRTTLTAFALLAATPAFAHVTLEQREAPVGASYKIVLRVPLKPLDPGSYKVIWRVLSVDTHRSNGEFSFKVGP